MFQPTMLTAALVVPEADSGLILVLAVQDRLFNDMPAFQNQYTILAVLVLQTVIHQYSCSLIRINSVLNFVVLQSIDLRFDGYTLNFDVVLVHDWLQNFFQLPFIWVHILAKILNNLLTIMVEN